MKPALITEEERRLISRRTKAALAVWKARGVKLGGFTVGSIRNRDEARQRAELLRPILAELAGMTARGIARELNERKVPTPSGGPFSFTINCPYNLYGQLERPRTRLSVAMRQRPGALQEPLGPLAVEIPLAARPRRLRGRRGS